ncbi:HypC/HybG/HupF family hydrogenase formation chaperone [Sphaerimonospora mesophila]|uniref:HypC/HybG/HupF family hydrogenase formation chaperone n=1 Tax=Sphaerimonospora mesophila TaxID=37483 RepID=UPI0006E19ACF
MCLGIPGEIVEILPGRHELAEFADLALVDVGGVRRKVHIGLLDHESLAPGDWVLIHVGFALSKIDETEAAATLDFLKSLGAAYEDEIAAFRESASEQE